MDPSQLPPLVDGAAPASSKLAHELVKTSAVAGEVLGGRTRQLRKELRTRQERPPSLRVQAPGMRDKLPAGERAWGHPDERADSPPEDPIR